MKIIIFDGIEPAAGHYSANEMLVFWRGDLPESCIGNISIQHLAESNSEELRAKYLELIYNLGNFSVQGSSLLNHLEIRPGFSYWWMTQIAEKCNFEKSPLIDDSIRLFAFEKWVQGRDISSIEIVTANRALEKCMRIWCTNRNINFKVRLLQGPKIQTSWLKSSFEFLPKAAQALVWLIHYLYGRWPLRGVGLHEWRNSTGRVTFVSYLFNLVPASIANGRFESRYWGPLPEVLKMDACATNWLHIYVKDALLPSAKTAGNLLSSFNHSAKGLQNHVALDTFLGTSVVIKALHDWICLMLVATRLKKWLPTMQQRDSHLWPLVSQDWDKSIFGVPALKNLLFLNLFETALDDVPQQARGVYLQENQGWEFGLLHAWKAAGHGRTIGCPHSIVRFWDLRYFFDPRSYGRAGKNDLPLPSHVACNGQQMRHAFKSAGYPLEDLVEVEALRYLQLKRLRVPSSNADDSIKGCMRVLVIGDYRVENTRNQMQLLVKTLPMLCNEINLLVKPHPACPIKAKDYPSLEMKITMQPIEDLINVCDVAYSSALTSGAVDAYSGGVPTVVMLDTNTLNLSPLRGCADVLFASTPKELAEALLSAAAKPRDSDGQTEFFTLDSQVPRWRALLQN